MNKKFTDEQIEFIKKNHYKRGRQELTDMLNAEFGTSYTLNQIKGLKARLHLANYEYGKGKKQVKLPRKPMTKEHKEKISKYFFKKGHRTYHNMPIGSESVTKDGYIIVKVDDKPKSKKNWKLKHRIVYESVYGPILEGKQVIFLDQNKRNFDPSNLALVEPEEMLYMTKNKLVFKDSDLNKSAVLVAKLETTAKRKVKKNEEC